jgi:SAM-dependent methyltransferase
MAQAAQRVKILEPIESSSSVRHNSEGNRVKSSDLAAHDWYRFVLSFPPHLVRDYFTRFGLGQGQTVLDPFCGTGTTVVEAKKLGFASVGLEAHPMAHFATSVKLDWSPDPAELSRLAHRAADVAWSRLKRDGLSEVYPLFLFEAGVEYGGAKRALLCLPEESQKLLLANSISPIPLHKCLVLLKTIEDEMPAGYRRHALLAFARTAVSTASNLHFGPEVGVGAPKSDAPVIGDWLRAIRQMADDLWRLRSFPAAPAVAHLADSRQIGRVLAPATIDAVITSPPYPNEKDYTRTTRLEAVLLGFVKNKADLQSLKRGLMRSNTRNVYKGDTDDEWVNQHPEINLIAETIEKRRIELGKTSGFERLYARVTKLYFGGMARHLSDLRTVLRPGARLAYVVGDQASYLRVKIRTGEILADIARSLGYQVQGIDLFRTRLATATREQLREEIVVLRWMP